MVYAFPYAIPKKYAFPGLKSVTCTFPYTFPFGTFFTKKNISAYAFPYTFPGKAYGNAYGFDGSLGVQYTSYF